MGIINLISRNFGRNHAHAFRVTSCHIHRITGAHCNMMSTFAQAARLAAMCVLLRQSLSRQATLPPLNGSILPKDAFLRAVCSVLPYTSN